MSRISVGIDRRAVQDRHCVASPAECRQQRTVRLATTDRPSRPGLGRILDQDLALDTSLFATDRRRQPVHDDRIRRVVVDLDVRKTVKHFDDTTGCAQDLSIDLHKAASSLGLADPDSVLQRVPIGRDLLTTTNRRDVSRNVAVTIVRIGTEGRFETRNATGQTPVVVDPNAIAFDTTANRPIDVHVTAGNEDVARLRLDRGIDTRTSRSVVPVLTKIIGVHWQDNAIVVSFVVPRVGLAIGVGIVVAAPKTARLAANMAEALDVAQQHISASSDLDRLGVDVGRRGNAAGRIADPHQATDVVDVATCRVGR